MTAAAVSFIPKMPEWNDKYIERFILRHALFMRRGMSGELAEKVADRLALRDYERDTRQCCIECKHLQHHKGRTPFNTCFQAARGVIPGTSQRHEPVTDILQRCEFFEFQKP